MPETQTKTLHDRIRAKVAETRMDVWPSAAIMRATLRHCDHADRILDRHRERKGRTMSTGEIHPIPDCSGCPSVPWPCPEVRDLAEAWGVSDA